jgi:hypothetical protein
MTREKTLGRIACTSFAAKLDKPPGGIRDNLGCPWSQYSPLGQQAWEAAASAIRAEVIEECAKAISNDFHWVLPLYDKDRLNEVSDDAAEEVCRQIVLTLRSLKEQPE